MALIKPTIFRWPRDNFKDRFEKTAFGKKWKSPEFAVEGVPKAKFYLSFYPKGDQSVHMNDASMYLHVSEFTYFPSIRAKVLFWFENGKKKLKLAEHELEFLPPADNWEWSNLCTQPELFEFAKNGPLVVCCKIVPLDCHRALKRALEAAPPSVLAKIAATFGSDKFADVEGRVQEKSFKVSKYVICSGSPVFARMFTHETKEKKTDIVEIKGVDADLIELMLRYFYSGEVEGLAEVAHRLLPVAHRFEVPELAEMCLKSLLANVSIETIIRDLQLANAHDHQGRFERKLVKFARKNFLLVKQQPDWTEFEEENAKIVKDISESP